MFGKPKEAASISPNASDKNLMVKKDSNESQDEKNFIFYINYYLVIILVVTRFNSS